MYHYVSLVNNLWLLLVAYQWIFYSYYWGIITCFLTIYAFLGLRELANNLAEPFGSDESDIPGKSAHRCMYCTVAEPSPMHWSYDLA